MKKIILLIAVMAVLMVAFVATGFAMPNGGPGAPGSCGPWDWDWFQTWGGSWYWQFFQWCQGGNGWYQNWGSWGWS